MATQPRLADDSWKAAYLFTCLVSDRDCGAADQEPRPDGDWLEMTRYDPEGRFAGCSTRQSIIETTGSDIRDRVQEFLHETESFFGYVVHRLWAKLSLKFASELVADRKLRGGESYADAYNLKINAVMERLCPLSASDGVLGRRRTVQHIFFLEPKADLAPHAPQEMSYVAAAAAVSDYLDAAGNRATPVLLRDIILLPEIGFGNPSYSCMAVRLRPYPDEDALQIPSVPMHILNLAAACALKLNLTGELSRLPISGDEYWDMFQTMKGFHSYSRVYMAQRTLAENLVQRSCEALEAMEERFPTRFLQAGYQEFEAFPDVRSANGWWSGRTLNSLVRQRTASADEAFARALRRVVNRTKSLDGFLRDAALADVSSTNLKLARNVRFLSWLVLFISLVALAVGLLPDSRKSAYFDALLGSPKSAQ